MSSAGTLTAPARWLAALLVLVAATTLFLGFDRGDIRPAEARLLLSVRPNSGGQNLYPAIIRVASSFSPWSLDEVGTGRLLSCLFLLATGSLLCSWLYRVAGGAAATAGALAMVASAPLPLLATQVSLAPPLAFLAMVTLVGLHSCRRGKPAMGVALTVVAGAAFIWLARTHALPAWVDEVSDRGLGPVYALLLGLPWTATWILVLSRGYRSRLAEGERSALGAASLVGAVALGASVWQPEFWLGASLISVMTGAVPVSFAWKHWHQGAGGFEGRLLGTLVLLVPLAALGLACVRIGINHQQMEKVQAIAVSGGVGLLVAAAAVRRRLPTVAWIPILTVALVGKIVYLGAFVPEWNARWSSRDNALAVARKLPPGAELFTDLPVDAAFEYYLGAPVQRLTSIDSENHRPPRHALVPASQMDALAARTGERWEVIRRFEWTSAGPLCLAREQSPRPADAAASAARDSGKR